MIYLDTHVAVWLYIGDSSKFSDSAERAVNEHTLRISPMVSLELTYLHEIGRLTVDAGIITDFLSHSVGLEICSLPFEQIVSSAREQTWTRDPFDRIIVGHAAIRGCGLVTKDNMIQRNYIHAIW